MLTKMRARKGSTPAELAIVGATIGIPAGETVSQLVGLREIPALRRVCV